ncbi:Cytochrome P450 [Roseateles sp. YR242]|uniref:hypothetical protein n=1 Tax=Roseateles sp. YR242 TaxID=1855305 RepID=UPI0008AEE0FB|nr:hypothetical protein [Roseateles sp. YR242]SEK69563.1 Cytochrome P450 [Roseateles sp. YR242]
MSVCPHALLTHPDLGVRPPGQPQPAHLARHAGAVADQFKKWLRQRDDDAHAAQKLAVTQALRAVSEDDVRREARRQASVALPGGWNHWVWAVPAVTVAGLLGLPVGTLDEQRDLVQQLRTLAAGLAPDADAADAAVAVARADQATLELLAALRAAEATAPDAPLQWAWLHQAGAAAWPDPATREANRLALLWQSHEAGTALLSHGLWALVRTGVAPDRTTLKDIAREGGAVRLTRRFAQRPTSCEGHALTTGDALSIELTGGDHAFGDGPHRCPGQGIALTSIEAALAVAARQQRLPLPVTAHPLSLPNMAILQFHHPLPSTEVST